MRKFFFYLLVFITALSLLTTPSGAESSKKFEDVSTGRGIIVSGELVRFYRAARNQVSIDTITLTNDFATKSATYIYPKAANFKANLDGSINFEVKDIGPANDLASWISIAPKEYLLDHREIKEFTFTITVPDNAAGGTHSAIILFPRTKEDEDTSKANAAFAKDQIGIPIFLTVLGDVDFDSSISDMYITDSSKEKNPTNFFWYGDAIINTVVQNEGNIYVRPFGNIFIHTGDKTNPVKTYEFNKDKFLVQPENKRLYLSEFNTNGFINEREANWFSLNKYDFSKFFDFRFGKYYATYQARIKPAPEVALPEDSVEVDERTVEFFVMPIQIVIISVILLIIVLTIVIHNIRSKKNSVKKL